ARARRRLSGTSRSLSPGCRPFRAPHHSATLAAFIGGASLKPGEVTLSHKGVLFLDEIAEFSRSVLESLREPLDNKNVVLSKAGGSMIYPADFLLCATTNPCPCGYLFSIKQACRCNPSEIRKYLLKLSGPLLDRFPLQIWVTSEMQDSDDIFTNQLKSYIKENKIADFVDRFLSAQNLLFRQNHSQSSLYEPSLDLLGDAEQDSSLSLRGKKQVLDLSECFKALFPETQKNIKFIKNIIKYRELNSIFQNSIKHHLI
ncbi:MAG: ATP-binding protein, partial [Silvanigrellaceae bacterium]|nr:ATP-binding protein [Silvanigrellaceae bacterium]